MSDKTFFFVSQVFYPDEVATASLFTDLCIELSDNNIDVIVWCSQPTYTAFEKQPKLLEYKGISITYLNGTNYRKDNILGRIINYTSFSFFLFLKLILSRDKTPVFTVTNPPFLGFIVSLASYFTKREFIYLILDVYPDGLIRLGKISENHFISRTWQRINKVILKRALKIIVLGRDMAEWAKLVCPSEASKISYIPHWQNENLFKKKNFNENIFVNKHNLKNKFIVQYSGNMGLWHNMKPFALVAKDLEFKEKDILFVFIGDGIRKKEMFEIWNNKVPRNTLLLPFQSKENIGDSLTACHIALISLREGLEGIAVPSKLYGILAAGVPIIGMVPEKTEISLVINEEKCGFVLNPGDTVALKNTILELKKNQSLRQEMGVNSRKAFEQKYTTKIISKKYIDIILEVSDKENDN